MDHNQNEIESTVRVLEPYEPQYPTTVIIQRRVDNNPRGPIFAHTRNGFRYMIVTASSTETLSVFLQHIQRSVMQLQMANLNHVNHDLRISNFSQDDPEFRNRINNMQHRGSVPFGFPLLCLVVADDVTVVDLIEREEDYPGYDVRDVETDYHRGGSGEIPNFSSQVRVPLLNVERVDPTICVQEMESEATQKLIFSDSSQFIEKYHLYPEESDDKLNKKIKKMLHELESFEFSSTTYSKLDRKKKSGQAKDACRTALLLELETNEMHICLLLGNGRYGNDRSDNDMMEHKVQFQIKTFSVVNTGLSTLLSPLLSLFKPKLSLESSDSSKKPTSICVKNCTSGNMIKISPTEQIDAPPAPSAEDAQQKMSGRIRSGEFFSFDWPIDLQTISESALGSLTDIHASGLTEWSVPSGSAYTVFLLDESDSIDNEGLNYMRDIVMKIVSDSSDRDCASIVRVGSSCSLDLFWTNNKCEILNILANLPAATGGPTPLAFGFFLAAWLLSRVNRPSDYVRIVLLSDGHPTRATGESFSNPPQDICIDEDHVREEFQDTVVRYLVNRNIPVFTVACSCEDPRDKNFLGRLARKTKGRVYPENPSDTKNIIKFQRYHSIQMHADRFSGRVRHTEGNREEMLELLSDYIRDDPEYVELVADEIQGRLENGSLADSSQSFVPHNMENTEGVGGLEANESVHVLCRHGHSHTEHSRRCEICEYYPGM